MPRSGRRPDRVEGRALSPRSLRPFGVEALVLGPASVQEGLVRRAGVAVWQRLPEHAAVFDRAADGGRLEVDGALPVRVVVAATRARDRALRTPALGDRAARVLALAAGPPPEAGWLLLVDEGPGERWLYLAEEDQPAAVLAGFLGRRGRTDFARARRRTRIGALASFGVLLGLVAVIYGRALGLGVAGQVLGGIALAASCLALVAARPR